MDFKIQKNVVQYCLYCGTKLDDEARFCKNCGEEIIQRKSDEANLNQNKNQSTRRIVYEGTLHKCPNCGSVLDSFHTNCPSCQLELRDVKPTKSIQDFAIQLASLGNNTRYSHNSKKSMDSQRFLLIETFPIPNSREDLLEFMILASSNINFKLYGMGNQGIITAARREISDAWISKMEQTYQNLK